MNHGSFQVLGVFKNASLYYQRLDSQNSMTVKKGRRNRDLVSCELWISKTNVSQRGNLVHVLPEFFSIEIVSFQYRFD